ncbi:unnamed protein product [Pleuronectes platessa]|uniref:Uncharacterized protein n=1 Tax=Pleuronectes platessa TaxID=8262 RepID=A0A9N7YBC9_PLEPL|nr:unnamed protein product [Pleuronectes platessa]
MRMVRVEAVDGCRAVRWDAVRWDVGRVGSSITAAAVYISIRRADHVRSHVPENADASSHGPGWALRWRATACGLEQLRQTLGRMGSPHLTFLLSLHTQNTTWGLPPRYLPDSSLQHDSRPRLDLLVGWQIAGVSTDRRVCTGLLLHCVSVDPTGKAELDISSRCSLFPDVPVHLRQHRGCACATAQRRTNDDLRAQQRKHEETPETELSATGLRAAICSHRPSPLFMQKENPPPCADWLAAEIPGVSMQAHWE